MENRPSARQAAAETFRSISPRKIARQPAEPMQARLTQQAAHRQRSGASDGEVAASK